MFNGITYSTLISQSQSLCQDTSPEALAYIKSQLSIGNQILVAEVGPFSNQKTRPIPTAVGIDSYQLPEDFQRQQILYVTVSNRRYLAEHVENEEYWQRIKSATAQSNSNYLSHFFVRGSTFEIYPIPSSVNTMTFIYEPIVGDMNFEDYTTGTITTLANGGTAVVGSGTSFSANMVGKFFKINANNQWYEIASVTDATNLVLVKAYQGTAISAGTESFTIGQFPTIPGAMHHILPYYSAWQYYTGFRKDERFGPLYKSQFEQYLRWAKSTFNQKSSDSYIPPQHHRQKTGGFQRNPNWFVENIV